MISSSPTTSSTTARIRGRPSRGLLEESEREAPCRSRSGTAPRILTHDLDTRGVHDGEPFVVEW